MAQPHRNRMTVAELDLLPDEPGTRYELFDGELVVSRQPHFEHQASTANLIADLVVWNRRAGLGRVFDAPGLMFGPFDAAAPDLTWASHQRLATIAGSGPALDGAPELVVEVLSPGAANQRRDRERKLRTYSRYGVQEYWLVDRWAQTVAIWRHDGQALRHVATLGADATLTSPLLPDFALPVANIFS